MRGEDGEGSVPATDDDTGGEKESTAHMGREELIDARARIHTHLLTYTRQINGVCDERGAIPEFVSESRDVWFSFWGVGFGGGGGGGV